MGGSPARVTRHACRGAARGQPFPVAREPFPDALPAAPEPFPAAFAAFAAAFASCLCARTFVSDSGPVMSATER